jgi:hypothetical protein
VFPTAIGKRAETSVALPPDVPAADEALAVPETAWLEAAGLDVLSAPEPELFPQPARTRAAATAADAQTAYVRGV